MIEVRRSDNPNKVADQFHYPIIRGAGTHSLDKMQSGGIGIGITNK